MTQGASCPRMSQLPTPPRPSTHLRVRTHTHTRTHTCPHTPSPRLRPAGGLWQSEPGTASARWVVPGAAAQPALSARKPSPASSVQSPRGHPGPQNAEASPATITRGGVCVPHREGITGAPEFKSGQARRKARILFRTLCVAIPPGLQTAESRWGPLPFFKLLPAFPGAGALLVRGQAPRTPGRRARSRGTPSAPGRGEAQPPASPRPAGAAGAAPRPPRAPGPRSSRGAPCSSSRPCRSRALTAVPGGTRRSRGCSPAVPSSLEPRPPTRAPWRPPNRRSRFRL